MGDIYIVKWHNEDAKYYWDVIPADMLKGGPLKKQRHYLLGENSDVIEAEFDVEIQSDGNFVLRYGGENSAHNDSAGVFTGDMKINPVGFKDTKFILWRDDGEKDFEPLLVTIDVGLLPEGTALYRIANLRRSERVRQLINTFKKHHGQCHACGTRPHPGYGECASAMFEPVNTDPQPLGSGEIDLLDTDLLCANCQSVMARLGTLSIGDFIRRMHDAKR